jgi:hypothetical protein
MKNIKDITLLAFAVIGFYTIITAFTTTKSSQPQQVYGTPESHVWETQGRDVAGGQFLYNKVTGEVRYHFVVYEKLFKDKKTGYVKLTEK